MVNFNGFIYDLFSEPRLEGNAEWMRVRLPGETALYTDSGSFTINSDFVSAHIDGSSMVALEDRLQAPVQLQAFADLQGVRIENYAVETYDGRISGAGQIDYSEGLQGELTLNGKGIDTGQLVSELPGELGFAATLLIESSDVFAIDVSTAKARIAERDFDGSGSVQWRNGKLTAVDANINAGTNALSADIKLDKQLAGSINATAPELAMLWPGLQGTLDATLKLGGTLEKPQAQMVAQASAVNYGSQSLQTMNLNAELKDHNQLEARLVATGLAANQQQLGNLDYALSGSLTEHLAKLQLSDGVVAVELRANSGWDGDNYTQQFTFGRLQPEGFDSWLLEQNPVLRLSAAGGQVDAHCWRQQQASICIDPAHWDASGMQGNVTARDFALATLQPLLAEGYNIDGTVNASLRLMRNMEGLQGELHWRQSRTTLGYADDINRFQTVLDDVAVDLVTDTKQTRLDATINGEQGLSVTASARVKGSLLTDSPLQATVEGRLPDIGLLRPLVQRVFDPGELDGELAIDLDAGGTLEEPLFSGGATIANGTLGVPVLGVVLTDINIAAESKGTDKLAVTGGLQSGYGQARIVGEIRAAENTELVADIRITGQNLAIVRVPDLSVDTSPDLKLHMGEGVFDVSGSLQIPKAMAEIRELPRNAVPRSPDVTVHEPDRTLQPQQETIVTGDIKVILGDDVRFNGFGLNSRLDGGLRLTQKRGGNLRTTGTVRVRDGFLTGYGKELRVDRGELTFTGPLDDPLINIQVSRESIYEGRQYTIGLRLSGTARNVITEPFSRPAMSDSDVLSFLLLDQPASSDSDATGAALALGLQQLFPDQSGVFGLDEVSFETNDANQAAMVAGKRINDRLYVRYVFGALGEPGAFRIRYRLGRGFSLEASTGSNQSMDLIYLLER
jgi:translocation and assembly module TamB